MPVDAERSLQGSKRALRDGSGTVLGVDAVQQQRELVAAEPGHGVARSQDARESTRERNQEMITDRVAEAVVDELEAIDVQEQHGASEARLPPGALQDLIDPIHEQ